MYGNNSKICWIITILVVKELFGPIYVFTTTKSSDSKLPKLTQKNTSWRKYQFHDRKRSSQRAVYLTGIDKYERLYYLSFVSSWFDFLYGFIDSKLYFFFSQQSPQDLWSWFLMSTYSLQTNIPEIPHSWGTASQLSFFLPVYFLRNLTKKMYIIQDPHARCSGMNCCGMSNQSLANSYPVSRLTCANSGKIILANREQCERAHQIISTRQLFMIIAMAMIINKH